MHIATPPEKRVPMRPEDRMHLPVRQPSPQTLEDLHLSCKKNGQSPPQRRKRGKAAYMPLVSMKPKLMDHIERTLFGTGLKALTLESRPRQITCISAH